jgi:hypothetical protein
MPDTNNVYPTTYRDELQKLIRNIWDSYDNCSPLRDFACGNEKEAFNTARGSLYNAAIALGRLDDSLSQKRADTIY